MKPGGKEDQAREMIAGFVDPSAPSEAIARNVGIAYAELCQRFMQFKPAHRPPAFSAWL